MNAYQVRIFSGTDPALDDYKSMIHSDFKKSLRYGNDWFKKIDSDSYFAAYKTLIHRLLDKEHVQVMLAVLDDDPDVCLGWSISEPGILHYVFVKKDFQRMGIGKALLPDSFHIVTHLTKIGQSIREKKFKKVIFNPFA